MTKKYHRSILILIRWTSDCQRRAIHRKKLNYKSLFNQRLNPRGRRNHGKSMAIRIRGTELVERPLNSNQVGTLMVHQSFVSVAESSFNGSTSETIRKSAKSILTNRTKPNPSEYFCITMYFLLCMSR